MNHSLSFIYPHKDRADLFRVNLESLLVQTDRDFEIVTVDNSENPGPWVELVKEFRDRGLNIKAAILDLTKHPEYVQSYNGLLNPAVSQNVAVKMSSGDIIVLSSPEVLNAETNVEKMKLFFSKSENHDTFCYGWIDNKPTELIRPHMNPGVSVEKLKELSTPFIKTGPHCRPEKFIVSAYYLGSMLKSKFVELGGIDERYLRGSAAEDNDFARRVQDKGMKCILNIDVAGIHQQHARNWVRGERNNLDLLHSYVKERDLEANKGLDWGSSIVIKEMI